MLQAESVVTMVVVVYKSTNAISAHHHKMTTTLTEILWKVALLHIYKFNTNNPN